MRLILATLSLLAATPLLARAEQTLTLAAIPTGPNSVNLDFIWSDPENLAGWHCQLGRSTDGVEYTYRYSRCSDYTDYQDKKVQNNSQIFYRVHYRKVVMGTPPGPDHFAEAQATTADVRRIVSGRIVDDKDFQAVRDLDVNLGLYREIDFSHPNLTHENLNLPIPDSSPSGVSQEFMVNEDVSVRSLEFHLTVLHPMPSDLKFYVRTNYGRLVELGPIGNHYHTLTLRLPPTFHGLNARGTWKVYVQDLQRGMYGTLEKARFILNGYIPFATSRTDSSGQYRFENVPSGWAIVSPLASVYDDPEKDEITDISLGDVMGLNFLTCGRDFPFHPCSAPEFIPTRLGWL